MPTKRPQWNAPGLVTDYPRKPKAWSTLANEWSSHTSLCMKELSKRIIDQVQSISMNLIVFRRVWDGCRWRSLWVLVHHGQCIRMKLYAPNTLLNYRATWPFYWSIILDFLNRDANERQGVTVAFCEECRQATFRAPPYPRNCSYRQDRDSYRQYKLDNRIEINVVVFEYRRVVCLKIAERLAAQF